MAVGRIADQAALGLAGLVLAARLSVDAYAAVALILVGHSVAATLSDLGLAHELLRLGSGEQASLRYLRVVRAINVLCVLLAIVLWGVWTAPVPALLLVLWAGNSEAMLRQSAAMLDEDHRRLGLAQVLAAAVLSALVVAVAHDGQALGLAIVARLLVELVVLRPCGRWFSAGPDARQDLQPLRVLITHGIGFGNRNVDFLVGAPFLGTAGFARYVFAYRLANAGFAPVGTIATRLGIAELGAGEELAFRYRRGTAVLFLGGLLAAVVTGVGALAVPWLVGERWSGAVALILYLTVALPFRFIDGVISPLLYVSANHGQAIKLELVRLAVIIAAVVAGAAFGGVTGLAVAMSAATIVSVAGGHRWAAHRAGIPGVAWLDRAAVVGLGVLALALAI